MTAVDPPRISPVAKLALLCGILAPLLIIAPRRVREVADDLGDDTFFVLLKTGPILAAIGLALAVVARTTRRNGVVMAALWLNGVWLVVYVLQSSR